MTLSVQTLVTEPVGGLLSLKHLLSLNLTAFDPRPPSANVRVARIQTRTMRQADFAKAAEGHGLSDVLVVVVTGAAYREAVKTFRRYTMKPNSNTMVRSEGALDW